LTTAFPEPSSSQGTTTICSTWSSGTAPRYHRGNGDAFQRIVHFIYRGLRFACCAFHHEHTGVPEKDRLVSSLRVLSLCIGLHILFDLTKIIQRIRNTLVFLILLQQMSSNGIQKIRYKHKQKHDLSRVEESSDEKDLNGMLDGIERFLYTVLGIIQFYHFIYIMLQIGADKDMKTIVPSSRFSLKLDR